MYHFHCSGGKLTPKRQYACEEDIEDQAQLTNFQSSTQETDTLQPPSTSVTDSDGRQSALQSAGPSTSSVDSGINSSHNSSSKLLQQDNESAVVPNEQLLQIEGLLGQVVKMMEELADRVGSLELQMQSINSHSQSGSSTESSNDQTSSSIEPVETVMESVPSNLGNFSDMQSTKSLFASMGTPEEQRKRHYSDSKMTRHRRSEIKNKLGTVVPKSHSVIDVSV